MTENRKSKGEPKSWFNARRSGADRPVKKTNGSGLRRVGGGKKADRTSFDPREWLTWPLRSGPGQRWFLVVVLSALLSTLIFPAFIEPTPEYRVGQVVDRDIKASRTYLIEDAAATEDRRRQARESVPAVYDYDDQLLNTLCRRIGQAFELMAAARIGDQQPPRVDQALADSLKAEFEAALGVELSAEEWRLLKLAGFGPDLEEGLAALLRSVLSGKVAPSREEILEQPERGIAVRRLSTGEERVIKDLYVLLDLKMAERRIRSESRNIEVNLTRYRTALRRMLADVAVRLLKPNLTPNRHETEKRRNEAAAAVRPVYYQVGRGEMLAREGEKITPAILARLKREAKTKKTERAWLRMAGMFVLLVVLLRCLYGTGLFKRHGRRASGKDLVFACSTVLFTFLLGRLLLPVVSELARGVPYLESQSLVTLLPVASGAMLIGTILGLEAALLTGLVISVLMAQLAEPRLEFFSLFLASSVVAARAVRHFKNRGTIIRAGLYAGLTNAVMILAIRMIETEVWRLAVPVEMLAGVLGGLFAGVIVSGLSPLVEFIFGYTTDSKLLELANLDQPVLKELLLQAPGSYHHSVIVANMVEAAAESIGANPLLAKVAAYYHDVGKIKKPLYFIENQAGENKHEKLAPSMSALILIAHVKDGVELARQAKLGREIRDIIAQHHGTSLITYFYDKAVKAAEKEKGDKAKVVVEDFRYPGPKPQTKEAGLVMLADQVEAACKSLAEPTPSRIQGMVQKIINVAFKDDQLSDCELTLKDLHAIAKSFNRVLAGIYHQRIAYPDQVAAGAAKRKANGDTALKRAEHRPDRNGNGQVEDTGDLKRLGIS